MTTSASKILSDDGLRPVQTTARIHRSLAALRSSNFRRFEAGQLISATGTWLTRTSIVWTLVLLVRTPFWLGVLAFVGQAPTLFLWPFVGRALDRFDRRRLLMTTQSMQSLQALGLCVLAATGRLSLAALTGMALLRGALLSVEIPARTSLLSAWSPENGDVASALAIDSAVTNLARILGPLLAASLITRLGVSWCFFLDSLSYVVSLCCLFCATAPTCKELQRRNTQRESWRAIWQFRGIRQNLILLAIASLVALPFTVLFPDLIRHIDGAGPQFLGALGTASSLGVLAALWCAASLARIALAPLAPPALMAAGIALILLSLQHSRTGTLAAVSLVSFAVMYQIVRVNAFLLSRSPDHVRGRISAVTAAASWGLVPFGSLILGGIASIAGFRFTYLLAGVTCIIGAAAVSGGTYVCGVLRPAYNPVVDDIA